MKKSIFTNEEKFNRFRSVLLICVRFNETMKADEKYINQRFTIECQIKDLKNTKQLFNWITDTFSDQLLNDETKLLLDVKETILNTCDTSHLFSKNDVKKIRNTLELPATPLFERKDTEELNSTLETTEEDDGSGFGRTSTILFTDWFEEQDPKLFVNINDKRMAPDTRPYDEVFLPNSKL